MQPVRKPAVARADIEYPQPALRDAEMAVQEADLDDRVEQITRDGPALDGPGRGPERRVFSEPLPQAEPVKCGDVFVGQPEARLIVAIAALPQVGKLTAKARSSTSAAM